jgi:DNA-binding SARP family transcriptional activator
MLAKQTMLSQRRSVLIAHAISKFSPVIFDHPVWIRFGKQELSTSLTITDNLLWAARNLQNDDPIAACQILLICAVYQNYTGQSHNAETTVQNSLALARQNGLPEEILWALWGACAISFQQGNHEQAASRLGDLQIELIERDEWVLANFVDVVKQSLPRPVTDSTAEGSGTSQEQPVADLLKLTFDWLQHWGYFAQFPKFEFFATSKYPVRHVIEKVNLIRLFFSIRVWQDRWNSLIRILEGKKNRFSQDAPLDPKARTLHPSIADSPPEVSLQKSRQALRNEEDSGQLSSSINMVVQMLGPFSITIQDSLLKLTASRGLSLFKYMLLHHKQSTPRDVLMDTFWPDADPEAARNNLNVAIYALRKELRSVTDVAVVCHENGAYCLSPDLKLWLDVDEFEKCIKTGQKLESRDQLTAAVTEYEIAINLYQGDFLAEDPYEDWTVLDRERLRVAYLDTLDHLSQIYFSQECYAACLTLCQRILGYDLCREDIHYRLMQCYSRLGQGPLALRQYQCCIEALQAELGVDPSPETTKLYEKVRQREQI